MEGKIVILTRFTLIGTKIENLLFHFCTSLNYIYIFLWIQFLHGQRAAWSGSSAGGRSCRHGAGWWLTMVRRHHHQGQPQRDPHLTETVTLHVGPPMLTSQEAHLTLHQEEPPPLPPTQMAAIHHDTKDRRHRVTVNAPRVITILSLAQNALMLHWLEHFTILPFCFLLL